MSVIRLRTILTISPCINTAAAKVKRIFHQMNAKIFTRNEKPIGDCLQLSETASLIRDAKKILGRDLKLAKFEEIIDTEHSLPDRFWNGTVNIVNENLRENGFIEKDVISKLDGFMHSANRSQFDAIAYRGEAYSARNKHLAKILNLKPGDKFTDNTYRYITGNPKYAENFSGSRDVTVKYNYLIPKGSICIGTCEETCALTPRETVSEILSIDKSDPSNIVINAILRTSKI